MANFPESYSKNYTESDHKTMQRYAVGHLIKMEEEYEVQTRPIKIDVMDCELDGIHTVIDNAFQNGQNDFAPIKNRRSLMSGDVIEYLDRYFVVLGFGFAEIGANSFGYYKGLSRDNRFAFSAGLASGTSSVNKEFHCK